MEPAPIKSTHPAPPVFFSLFTDESKGDSELWTPPPPPGTVDCFGAPEADTLISHQLPTGVPVLFQQDADGSINYSRELRKLNRATADGFVGLLDAVVKEPASVDRRADDVSNLFMNTTHLLNRIRAHQARQILISTLKRQIDERLAKADQLQKLVDETVPLLQADLSHIDLPAPLDKQQLIAQAKKTALIQLVAELDAIRDE